MHKCDWMSLADFQNRISSLQHQGVHFISLAGAYRHIQCDIIRFRKYAVLTFDDGYASLKEILPWLKEQSIPCTLFINGKYLDGESYRQNPNEKYLNSEDLLEIVERYRSLVSVQSHGWEHSDATKMTEEDFRTSMLKNIEILTPYTKYSIPICFHAYTWGRYSVQSDKVLYSMNIKPVRVNGVRNYNDINCINRELL